VASPLFGGAQPTSANILLRSFSLDPLSPGVTATPFFISRLDSLSRHRSRRSIWVWLFDLVVDAGTLLWMSRSWKECRHLAPDVSILERLSVTGPGCIREGCMSCVVMSTYVSTSTYVSCAGMSRRTYGSCENCVYKEGFSRVFSSSSLHATSCILFGISTLLPFPPFPLIPSFRRSSSAARPCPTCLSDAVRLSVRHVSPTVSVPLSDTSI